MENLHPVPFFFLRHGETDWNTRGLTQGRTDIPLNAAGLAQADAAAGHLAGQGIAGIVCSPLGRARQTAEAVGRVLDLDYDTDPGLREASFGAQEGQPMGHWYDDWVTGAYTPEGGESFAQLTARVVPAINHALARPGPVLVVAHGAMFRAVRAAMGLSALVRTENGVPLHCAPGTPWRLTDMGAAGGPGS
jgi:probable phosphoglycerate mutase